MTVHVLEQEYQTAGEKSHIKNWLNMTVGLRIDGVNKNDKDETTSIGVTVFTADDTETGEPARIDSRRVIGQIASSGVSTGDVLVVAIVPLGKRGQVLAPPKSGDKTAEALTKALS